MAHPSLEPGVVLPQTVTPTVLARRPYWETWGNVAQRAGVDSSDIKRGVVQVYQTTGSNSPGRSTLRRTSCAADSHCVVKLDRSLGAPHFTYYEYLVCRGFLNGSSGAEE